MFCTKCGAEIPEGAKFCIMCGASSGSDAPAAPAQPPAYVQPQAAPVSKSNYFWKSSPKQTRTLNIISIAVGLLCILFLLLSINKFVNGPIYEIPIMRLGIALDEVGIDDLEAEIEDMIDLLEDIDDDDASTYEFYNKYGIDLDYLDKEYDISVNDMIELLDPPSLNKLYNFAIMADELDNESRVTITFVLSILTIVTILHIILALLAVIFRKTWIAIVAYVLSFGFIAFTGGLVFWILATVAYITSAVLYSKLNGSYKTYLASFGS